MSSEPVHLPDDRWRNICRIILEKPDFEDVKIQMKDLVDGKVKSMSKISRYYFYDERIKARHWSGASFHDIFIDRDAFDFEVNRALKYSKKDGLDSESTDEWFAMRLQELGRLFRQHSIVSMFPIQVAREFMHEFNVNGIVYDYSCGWGNRLTAAMAEGLTYFGTDTNPSLCERLRQCLSDFRKHTSTKSNGLIMCQGSEVFIDGLENKVGLCFSSPPYFGLEKYEGEGSCTKMDNYGEWMEKYLKPTISNCSRYLVDGGFFCCNIKDFKKYPLFEDTKNAAVDAGLEYSEVRDMKICRRSGSQDQKKDFNPSEGIMVFRKPALHH